MFTTTRATTGSPGVQLQTPTSTVKPEHLQEFLTSRSQFTASTLAGGGFDIQFGIKYTWQQQVKSHRTYMPYIPLP